MDIANRMKELRGKSKITKIVSSRTIRSVEGDKTLEMVQEFEGTHEEAEFAALILSMQVDLAVLRHAYAGGLIPHERFQDQQVAMKSSYGKLIVDLVSGKENE